MRCSVGWGQEGRPCRPCGNGDGGFRPHLFASYCLGKSGREEGAKGTP